MRSTAWPQQLKIDYIRVWQDASSFVAVDTTGTDGAEHWRAMMPPTRFWAGAATTRCLVQAATTS